MTRSQSSYGQQPYPTQSISSLGGIPTLYTPIYGGGGFVRPGAQGEVKRQSDSDSKLSPTSTNSGFGGFCTPPESQTAFDDFSSISPLFSPEIHLSGQNPFVRSNSFSGIYQSQAHDPWQNLPSPLSRARAGSLASQPGSSMLYAGSTSDYEARPSSQHVTMELPKGYFVGDGAMNRITNVSGKYLLKYLHAVSC